MGVSLRSGGIAALVMMCALLPSAASADDFGFAELTTAISDSVKGDHAFVPFIERPTAVDVGFTEPQGFGYLGSVANPRKAFPRSNSQDYYYRGESDDKCNPKSFIFPAGQGGLQRVVYGREFKFELKAGELTFKGGSKKDSVFTLSAFSAKILKKIKIQITDLKEYTLDNRYLKARVREVSAVPDCAKYKFALTKVYEGKLSATYYFEAGADATAALDLAGILNAKLGLSVISKTGMGETEPNAIQFESAPRMIAARFRTVSDVLGQ